ncbi:MAG: trypsin-like peptidase domain-containing protein [SAR324 cluster bacterium]|nr:trypsin-like peptidase domain-containing protein [SAR324 cluster bacterium]
MVAVHQRFRLLLAVVMAVVMMAALGSPPLAAHPDSFSSLVKAQQAKIVHIKTKNDDDGAPKPRKFFGPYRPPEFYHGMGSGFIISDDGLIVTNHHVVEGVKVIEVVLSDETTHRAQIVGMDERTDLALIKIDAENLPYVSFGDSATLEVGDWVVAIGNPLGLDHSVTAGIISAKGRNIFDAENVAYGEFIQTDAAINPGNSGGPLFNLDGEVIGVNTAVSSRGQGIGFALPSNLVVSIVQQIREHGRVIRGWLGVVIQEATVEWSISVGLPRSTRGILINDIVPNAPASRSSLRKGDVIISFDHQPLKKVPHLQKLVAFTPPGSTMPLEVMRRIEGESGWERITVEVRIGFEPSEKLLAQGTHGMVDKLDISLAEVPDDVRQRRGIAKGQGLMVERVGPNSLGGRMGLKQGDIILEVARQAVGDKDDLERVLRKATSNRIPILVQRDDRTLYLTLPAPQLK